MSDGPRIAIVGNAGGGKSVLARRLAQDLQLPLLELDRILWREDWRPAPEAIYKEAHSQMIATGAWIIDGLGRRDSISERLRRTTVIILIDMPIWMHFWLAAERQTAWKDGILEDPPAGAMAPPSTEALFRTIFEVDRDWMPEIRVLIDLEEKREKRTVKIESVEALRRGFDLTQASAETER